MWTQSYQLTLRSGICAPAAVDGRQRPIDYKTLNLAFR